MLDHDPKSPTQGPPSAGGSSPRAADEPTQGLPSAGGSSSHADDGQSIPAAPPAVDEPGSSSSNAQPDDTHGAEEHGDHEDEPAGANSPEGDQNIVIEHDANETDSALDDTESLRDSLTSLRPSILAYRHENGRTYHAMSDGKYFLPNDAQESERLDLQHHVLQMTIEGRDCMCPKNDGAKCVLDLGTGTGIWAIDYADRHPEAAVFGIDLSPVQPDFVPPNCVFELDDLEKDWTFDRTFDFIFCRMMAGSFKDNGSIVQKAFAQLEPGGYLECQDMGLPLGCDDGTLSKDSDLWIWMSYVMAGMEKLERPVVAAQQWKTLMEQCGFVDVQETVYKWPINQWPRDPKYKQLGLWSLTNMNAALESSTLAPLTRGLGWTHDEVMVLVSKARRQLRNTSIHAYWPMYFVHGRKPLDAEGMPPNMVTADPPHGPGSPRPVPSIPETLEAEPPRVPKV